MVVEDHAQAMEVALRHLLGKGHRRIGLITPNISFGIERVEAWRILMRESNCPSDDGHIYHGDLSTTTGRTGTLELLKLKPRPTAILATGVLNASGAVQTLRELGLRCPEDVEIMSAYNNKLLDGLTPAISSVVHATHEMGVKAVKLLMKRIREPTRPPQVEVVPTTLKIRCSART